MWIAQAFDIKAFVGVSLAAGEAHITFSLTLRRRLQRTLDAVLRRQGVEMHRHGSDQRDAVLVPGA